MRAAVIRKNGGLECLSVEDVPEPKPSENEVILEVRSAALLTKENLLGVL
jgi:NADPH:quinone reductase-like Zn-dependent oxidoreductase